MECPIVPGNGQDRVDSTDGNPVNELSHINSFRVKSYNINKEFYLP